MSSALLCYDYEPYLGGPCDNIALKTDLLVVTNAVTHRCLLACAHLNKISMHENMYWICIAIILEVFYGA